MGIAVGSHLGARRSQSPGLRLECKVLEHEKPETPCFSFFEMSIGQGLPSSDARHEAHDLPDGTFPQAPAAALQEGAGVYDPETGALARSFVNFMPRALQHARGYGKTPAHDGHPFLKPGIVSVVAPTGGGKTMVIMNLLSEVLSNVDPGRMNRVMYYTGSPQDDLLQQLNPEVIDVYDPENQESFLAELRDLLLDHMNSSNPTGVAGGPGSGEIEKPFNVLVLDDAGNSRLLAPSQTKGTDIGEVMMRHRHLRMLLIASAQRWNMLPPFVRSNASHIFLFPGGSKKENDSIFSTVDLPQEQLQRVMSTLQGREHEFLWIDRSNRSVKRGFSQTVLR